MPLNQPIPPAAAQAAFASTLPSFLAGPAGLGTPTSVGVHAPPIPTAAEIGTGFSAALQAFTLRLGDAAHFTGAISPASSGWQFYAGDPNTSSGQVILGGVSHRPPKAWKMTNMYYGLSVKAELLALKNLSTFTQFESASYEARILIIPGVNVRAFWIAAQQAGGVDYVVPFPEEEPLIPGLSGSSPYDLPTFMAAVAPIAAHNLTAAAYTGG